MQPLLFCSHRRAYRAYGIAHFGKSLFWQAGEVLLAFFLTEAAGLTPSAMGAVIALSLLASAASDLLVGHLWRRTLGTLPGVLRMQWLGALLAALSMLALFSTAQLAAEVRLPFALAMALLFRVSYSIYDTPQNVLMSLVAADGAGRGRIATMRVAVSSLAGLCLALVVVPLVQEQGWPDRSSRFVLLATALATVAVISAWHLRQVLQGVPAGEHVALLCGGKKKAGQLSLPLLLGMFFVLLAGGPLFVKLEPYFVVHVLESPRWGSALLLSGALGTLLAQPLTNLLLLDQPRDRVIALGSMALLMLAAIWTGVASLAPVAVVCAAAFGLVVGVMGMTLWAEFADGTARLPPIRIGLAYGALTATSKLALALGAWMLGSWLEGFDYRGQDSSRLTLLMALGPALGAGGCLLLMAGPGITRRLRSGVNA